MRFTIETKKTKEEIINVLTKNTSDPKIFAWKYDKFFIGQISEDTFKIWRNINYRNSFAPLIIGKIELSNDICKIHVKTRMTIFVIVFVSIWLSGVTLACLITPFVGLSMPSALIPYMMLIIGGLIMFLPKRMEEKIAKEKLEKLLK